MQTGKSKFPPRGEGLGSRRREVEEAMRQVYTATADMTCDNPQLKMV